MDSTSPEHEKALALARQGRWAEAAAALEPLATQAGEPWLVNDFAVTLHQSGEFERAVALLAGLGEDRDLPGLVRLNRMYMTKALEISQGFDPSWKHLDYDRSACPDPAPAVSVIVRTYNRPDLLPEALASLKNQTLQDFEAIIVNDGGRPEAEDAVKKSGLKSVRYFYAPHQGCWAAMNYGLAMAHGRYVTGLDDDDRAFPDHLARLVQYLESPGAAPIVFAKAKISSLVSGSSGRGPAPISIKGEEFKLSRLFETNLVPSVLAMVRRDCYREAGRFCDLLPVGGDWEMWLRLAERFPLYHLPAVTAEIREQPGAGNLSSRRRQEKYYWDNLILYLHRGIVALSAPREPKLAEGYRKLLEMMDRLGRENPEALARLNLRGLWTTPKPYRWLADQARWFYQMGELELARRCYGWAARLDPLQPKLWAGWARSHWK